jgi:hypothetical protein
VLTVVEDETGAPVPARVELLDASGEPRVPEGAMPVRGPECLSFGLPEWLRPPREVLGIDDPFQGTRQFYVDATLEARLQPGRYRLRVFKGIEHEVARRELLLEPGARQEQRIRLGRWTDHPRGWYSADGHVHVSRRGPEDDAPIARWMRAEDLDAVALLQAGNAERFDITPQYAFGAEGVYREADGLLLTGQEHPRTHLLGHTVILGASKPIDLRDTYLIYDRFWTEATSLGGVSGYAHWGLGPARDGLAIDAPGGLVTFIEVLAFGSGRYEAWYDLLDVGLVPTPTAGTDYPCNPFTLPGRERFYARVDGALRLGSWLEAIRRGRTFVTNGPLLEIDISGAGIGDELRLPRPGALRVTGRARFDPTRDDVEVLELVRGGEVVAAETERSAPGEIRLDLVLRAERSAWYALRASGRKIGETRPPARGVLTPLVAWTLRHTTGGAPFIDAFLSDRPDWASAAHTGAIRVSVAGTPPIAAQAPARAAAARLRARLERLRERLAPERLGELPIWSVAIGDGAPLEVIERDRDALLARIDAAIAYYERLTAPQPRLGAAAPERGGEGWGPGR